MWRFGSPLQEKEGVHTITELICAHTITEGLGLEGSSGDQLVQP